MLRIIAEGSGALPWQLPVDPSATFEAGACLQLGVLGSQIVATVSNGTAFIGIADDVKTRSFTGVSWDETVITPPILNPILNGNNQLVSPIDIKMELENPNVDANSFVSVNTPCQLIPRNGVIVFPAGSILNFDVLGTGIPNAIKTLVRYAYFIPNIQGDDSTWASQMVTIWYSRFIGETDQYEVNQQYAVNSNLFINEVGKLTTRQIFPNSIAIAIVTAPPAAIHSTLQFMLL
jgi:hypothetical protein